MERKYYILCFSVIYTLCLLGMYIFNIQIPLIGFCRTNLQENNSHVSVNKNFFEVLHTSNLVPPLLVPYGLWRPINANHSKINDRLIEQYKWIKHLSNHIGHKKKFQRKKIILFDTEEISSKHSQHIQCPGYELKLCTVTKSEDVQNPYDVVGNFDAAVFAYVHRYNITNLVLPQHVKQVIHTEENSSRAKVDFGLNNAISATYFSGSDIVIPYGKWIPYDESITAIIPSTKIEMHIRNNIPKQQNNFARGKTGVAIMFASNCRHTDNNRMGFVEGLQKHMKVDVYGKCGTFPMNCTKIENKNGNCMDTIIKRYKFYLAFENSNCRDYITEKVYHNAIGNNVIPVVLGAHPEDYERELPKHSYIHVEDFDSPKELAEYLNFLNKNDALYNKYFEWKGKGEFHPARNYYLCRICGMLFYNDYVSHPVWNTTHSAWKNVNKCLSKNEWYWKGKNSRLNKFV